MNIVEGQGGAFHYTCVNSLPAHSKGRAGLDDVAGDGAAVVPSQSPRKLGRAVCDLVHCHFVRRTWRTWISQTMKIHETSSYQTH